jgi:tetratricopeptide (TPR) repeat protein
LFFGQHSSNELRWLSFSLHRMKSVGFAVLLGLVLAGSGCKTHVNPAKASGSSHIASKLVSATNSSLPTSSLDEKSAEKRVEALARYSTGLTYELNEKSDAALEEFYKSAQANPGNEPLVIELASRLVQKKETAKAIEVLQQSCQRSAASGAVFAILAKIQLREGKTNSALQTAQTAIKRSPEMLVGHEALSSVYLAADRTQDSLKTLDRAATMIKSEPGPLIGLGELYASHCKLHPKEKEGIAPRAKIILKRALDLQPKPVALQQKLADTLVYFGEAKSATEVYLKLLSEEDNEEVDAWRDLLREKLANLYLFQNDKTNAAEQLEAIIRDNPTKYPHAYYILGTISYDQKNYKRAAECFEKTILLSPELEQVYYDLAGTQINLDQPNRALALLDQARGKFNATFVSEFFSAVACNKLKKYNEALKHYMTAEILAKGSDSSNRLDHSFYFQTGAVYERVKNYVEAEKYFLKALEKSPNNAETLNYLGYMWTENGTNLSRAKEFIEKAVKLEPKNAAYLDSLGWVFFKLKDSQQALSYILKAIELSTEPDAALFDHLGDIYLSLKEPAKAHAAWEKSLKIEPNDEIKKKLSSSL